MPPHLTFRIPLDVLDDSLHAMGSFPVPPTDHDGDGGGATSGSRPVQFRGPALFIRGSKSEYIQSRHLPDIKAMFPSMQLVELEGGHFIHAEQPNGVLMSM